MEKFEEKCCKGCAHGKTGQNPKCKARLVLTNNEENKESSKNKVS